MTMRVTTDGPTTWILTLEDLKFDNMFAYQPFLYDTVEETNPTREKSHPPASLCFISLVGVCKTPV